MLLILPRATSATSSAFDSMTAYAAKHVLIIDDDSNIRAIVSTCLSRLGGWQISSAACGYQALQLIATARPDAIVLDIMMPGMDGISFLRQLRSSPDLSTIPVVFLTGNVDFTHALATAEWGVAGAIAKPFNPVTLAQQVAEILHWQD